MSSFLRFAGAAALVLSFGLAARALPLGIFGEVAIKALAGTDAICAALNHLIVDCDIVAKLTACVNVATLAELQVAIAACVEPIKACADALLNIDAGVGAAVDASVKADIVVCLVAFISLIVKVCLQLTLKFGVSVVATLLAELDLCVKLLLVNLNICIAGIMDLIVKACASATVSLMAEVSLAACAKLLGN
ncbi:hypothetical protein RSAG8_11550, partial [Rhizoctonia solani AG-8 WAC10335]